MDVNYRSIGLPNIEGESARKQHTIHNREGIRIVLQQDILEGNTPNIAAIHHRPALLRQEDTLWISII